MNRTLKVYGGACFPAGYGGKQWYAVIAAFNQREAATILGDSLYSFRLFWCETANAEDIAKALATPGTLVPTNPC